MPRFGLSGNVQEVITESISIAQVAWHTASECLSHRKEEGEKQVLASLFASPELINIILVNFNMRVYQLRKMKSEHMFFSGISSEEQIASVRKVKAVESHIISQFAIAKSAPSKHHSYKKKLFKKALEKRKLMHISVTTVFFQVYL